MRSPNMHIVVTPVTYVADGPQGRGSHPAIVRIDSTFDGMPLMLYLVRGQRAALIDSGVASTPLQHVLPALAAHALAPGGLDYVVHTHAHLDHIGGDADLRRANPGLRIAAHRLGAGFIENHRRYYAQTYTAAFPGVWEPPAALEERILRLCGENCLVDEVFDDGDRIDLGGRALEAIAVPGHSADHVVLRDSSAGAVFSGDALQGRGLKREDGSWLFPMYTDVAVYRSSLSLVEDLAAPVLCTGHNGALDPDGQAEFLAESRAFADELDDLLRSSLSRAQTSLTEAVNAVAEAWPQYDGALQMYTTIESHLDDLGRRGLASRVLGPNGSKQWRAEARRTTAETEENSAQTSHRHTPPLSDQGVD